MSNESLRVIDTGHEANGSHDESEIRGTRRVGVTTSQRVLPVPDRSTATGDEEKGEGNES